VDLGFNVLEYYMFTTSKRTRELIVENTCVSIKCKCKQQQLAWQQQQQQQATTTISRKSSIQ
jgi:hypothetical protein